MAGDLGPKRGEFSVCLFFDDDSSRYVRRFVSAEEAVKAAVFYTTNVAARLGLTKSVIITDGGDCVNWEWRGGKVIYDGTGKPPDA